MPEPSRSEFSENLLTNNFALTDAGDNASRSLNRGGITDLPFIRKRLAIR